MKKLGFITCADLSRYFVSPTHPLFTHDDQLAADFLKSKGWDVAPVIWGTPPDAILGAFDMLVVRSPWDYMDSSENRSAFFAWLKALQDLKVPVINDVDILTWNLDKHYLKDLKNARVRTVPTRYLEQHQPLEILAQSFIEHKSLVVKPCIGAGARDTYRLCSESELNDFLKRFEQVRGDRAWMIQPYLADIESGGEWSLVFLGGEYAHAVLKRPKVGGWLVQDELGGSVTSAVPPGDLIAFATDAYQRLSGLLVTLFPEARPLVYARVDVMPGMQIGELELVEPELFFLDRRSNLPNVASLQRFFDGLKSVALQGSRPDGHCF